MQKKLFFIFFENSTRLTEILFHTFDWQFNNIEELKAAIMEEWENFQQSTIDKAVDAFRRRLGACVSEDGGPIEHLFS